MVRPAGMGRRSVAWNTCVASRSKFALQQFIALVATALCLSLVIMACSLHGARAEARSSPRADHSDLTCVRKLCRRHVAQGFFRWLEEGVAGSGRD